MLTNTYIQIRQLLPYLSYEERKQLIEEINEMNKEEKSHSILELEGLGADIWASVGVQRYIDKERESCGKVVGLDATLLLYYMQKNAKYISVLRSFFHAVNNREILAVTSSIVLLEINFNPIKLGHSELAKAYKDILLNSPGFT